jgi:hypothetical protein
MTEPKRPTWEEELIGMAALLGEGDDALDRNEVRHLLRGSGISPDKATARFHEAALKLAERERTAGREVPLALDQAIQATGTSSVSQHQSAARTFAASWLDRFLLPFALPSAHAPARAYRKSGGLAEKDAAYLDRLARELQEQAGESRPGAELDLVGLMSEAFLARFGLDCGKRLFDVAYALGLEIRHRKAESYEGALLRVPGSRAGFIVLNSKIKEESRQRFTLAHEIGHHVLPGQQELAMPCVARRIENWQQALEPDERAANRFAAEILMPREAIQEWLDQEPSLEAIRSIADACRTSLTSSAVRLAELTRYAAAVVWSEAGRALWYHASPSFVRWVRKGRLDERTVAARRFGRMRLPEDPEAVPAAAWLFAKGLKPDAMLWESAVALPAYSAVLSLLVLREPVTESESSGP